MAEKKGMRLRFWLGYAVVAAIAIGSVAIALVVHDREADNFEQVQQSEASRSARQVEAVARLSVGQLASAAAFYQTVNRLTDHKFDVMAELTARQRRTLAARGCSSRSPAPTGRGSNACTATRSSNASGSGSGDDRVRAHATTRSLFGASDSNLKPPLGLDIGSDPLRAPYIRRARDSGNPTATRVIRLPIGGTGINVFRPVYRDGAPTATVAQRRAALTGFALGSFHVPT